MRGPCNSRSSRQSAGYPSAFIFARLALVLRAVVVTAITMGILGRIGYLIWKVL
jgi:hypothetical protein